MNTITTTDMTSFSELLPGIREAGLPGHVFQPEGRLGRHKAKNPDRGLVLGLACHYHDSSVCLLENGKIVFAAEEERFSRSKHDHGFPGLALEACMAYADIRPWDVDLVVFYEDPVLKLRRILTHNSGNPDVLRSKLARNLRTGMTLPWDLRSCGYSGPIEYAAHHAAHAASAFYPSPFDQAAILTLDAVGEYATCEVWHGQGQQLSRIRTVLNYPQSLGMLYSAITSYLGFKVNNDEYKVMGLASYGRPTFLETVKKLAGPGTVDDFSLDMRAFVFDSSEEHLVDFAVLEDLLGFPPRRPESQIRREHQDLAASVQFYLERLLSALTASVHQELGCDNLCMAGGVALNCVANARIMQDSGFKDCFIQPAAGDAGGALGAALLGAHVCMDHQRKARPFHNTCLGPEFTAAGIEDLLHQEFVEYDVMEWEDLLAYTARQLAQGQVVAWFQGRMEFGPRALGNRSILADPRHPGMQDILNAKVKHRESFRPFAAAVLAERAEEYFDIAHPDPFMLFTANVLHPQSIPAVTHIDGSSRIQTVHHETNPRFYALIKAFERVTEVPVLVNTSFNVRGEPIVCTPQNAYDCYLNTGIDILVMDRFVIKKEANNHAEQQY